MAGRRHPLARIARRVPDRLRHRGAQRHPADQPLPASRARGGPGLRAGARAAGRAGAARAHPDDGLATGLALVPLAVAGSIPGHEIEHPMAIVILGGLVTSTLLNLFVAAVALPALRQAAHAQAARGRRARPGGRAPGRTGSRLVVPAVGAR